jgi:UDP-N-acetylmuramate dehydrogenase
VHILENVDLRLYSTMRLGGKARYLAEAHSEADVEELVKFAKDKEIDLRVIGEGSNIVWRDEGFPGVIIVNKIMGLEMTEAGHGITFKVGAGEDWDDVVAASVAKGLTGIEFLSAIPGKAGAAPVQNIGAYGVELSSVLAELEAYDSQNGSFGALLNEDCGFSYRNSRFKSTDKGRFIITGIVLKLKKGNPVPPFYESLDKYFKENNVSDFTPQSVRDAVITIRKIRLPDPSIVANNGSFFTNPFVDEAKFKELQAKYPDIKGWPAGEGKIKLAAGWLVETAGFKEVHDQPTGMATWSGNSLVMVNESAKSTADLLAFKQKIQDKVKQMFGVSLEQEPELLP